MSVSTRPSNPNEISWKSWGTRKLSRLESQHVRKESFSIRLDEVSRCTSTSTGYGAACCMSGYELTSFPPPASFRRVGLKVTVRGGRCRWSGVKRGIQRSEGVLDKGVVTVSPPNNKQPTLTLICLFYPSTCSFVPFNLPRVSPSIADRPYLSPVSLFTCAAHGARFPTSTLTLSVRMKP